MRRTVPPSAEIQASIDKLLSRGMVDDPQKMLSELARLGARLIIQGAVDLVPLRGAEPVGHDPDPSPGVAGPAQPLRPGNLLSVCNRSDAH